MKNPATGAILILAYPEEFVRMIPAWYRKPMEWIGMVNNGMTCVGHAAMALIDKATGEIHYGDFGRYITAEGYGRTRMKHTDPDVEFDFKVEFDENGDCVNKIALFQHIYDHPEKTHGGECMFVSLNQDVDFEECYSWLRMMNEKGSIKYDPFGKGNSNCSRFVYDAILQGATTNAARRKLKSKSPITPSPLGNVFHGTNEESYEFRPEGHFLVEDISLRKILPYFFIKPSKNQVQKTAFKAQDHMHFLDGIGDQAYFFTKNTSKTYLTVTKLDGNGNHSYTFDYGFPPGFDPQINYKFIHDCNAAWLTIEQGGQQFRLDRKSKA